MDSPDARHLTIETQNYLRQQAIRLRQQGKRVKDISEYLGVHRNTVSEWWWEYEQDGEGGLYQRARGRQVGDGRILAVEEEEAIQAAMQDHWPEEYGIDSALWTRRAVQGLIEQVCGIKLPVRTVGDYLRRWGYTPKKPIQRAYEQDPEAVKAWLEEVYPQIVERAEHEGAVIVWGDEAGVSSNEYGGRGYAPIGEKAEVRPSQGQRGRINYIASLTNQGSVRFMLYLCTFSANVLIKFLGRLIQGGSKKLFWVGDHHPVHEKPKVKRWLDRHAEQIEMFFLPTYSPELNPAEYLNNSLKQRVHDQAPTRNLDQLQQRVRSQLHRLQKLPEQIRNYFNHPSITYAGID
jgi:transposase